jgi:hypothetical protein
VTQELILELEAQAAALTARVASEMYRDPFWSARFGERGRKFTEEDGRFHVSYLVQALVAQDPEVLARYGRWLRSVLTTRGMCTRHLVENFERLALAVRELSADAQPAVGYLRAAQAALHAELATARPLEAANERLTAGVCAWLASSGATREGDAIAEQRALPQQISSLISYLADALVLARAEHLVAHVRWLDSWLGQQPAGQGLAARLVSGLGRQLLEEPSLPEAVRAAAGDLLRQALAAIGGESAGGALAS